MQATDDVQAIERVGAACQRIVQQLRKSIVGQRETIEQLLIGLLAQGHCLVVGVPGLAKTLIIRTLAETLNLDFRRIQFTPDLMPSDITGTEIIQEEQASGVRQLRFVPGPLFGNVILADEINRTPPKTQSALLEAMQERQVTAAGIRYPVPTPFYVLATQNPIEQEGTYPLPEAQLDRFLLNIVMDYPDQADELQVLKQTTGDALPQIEAVVERDQLEEFLHVVRRIPLSDSLAELALHLARSTRPAIAAERSTVRQYVAWGAGPRGGQAVLLAAKARAAMEGRFLVTRDDVMAVALPALRHRICLNFAAEADGITSDQVLSEVMAVAGERDEVYQRRASIPVFRSFADA